METKIYKIEISRILKSGRGQISDRMIILDQN